MITKSDFDRAEAIGIISFTFSGHVQAELAALRAQRDDLLAALQMAVLYLEHPEVEAIPFAKRASTAAEQVRAAIARATGQGE